MREEGGGNEGARCGDREKGRQKGGGQSVRVCVGRHGVTCAEAWQGLAGNYLGAGGCWEGHCALS
jgi:hypothetical protein